MLDLVARFDDHAPHRFFVGDFIGVVIDEDGVESSVQRVLIHAGGSLRTSTGAVIETRLTIRVNTHTHAQRSRRDSLSVECLMEEEEEEEEE